MPLYQKTNLAQAMRILSLNLTLASTAGQFRSHRVRTSLQIAIGRHCGAWFKCKLATAGTILSFIWQGRHQNQEGYDLVKLELPYYSGCANLSDFPSWRKPGCIPLVWKNCGEKVENSPFFEILGCQYPCHFIKKQQHFYMLALS